MPGYYDITVTLDDVDPPVWRRFHVAADATFADLHRAIQDACGWENYHLFEFTSPDGQRIAGLPDQDWGDEAVADASTVPLSSVLPEQGVVPLRLRLRRPLGAHRAMCRRRGVG